MESYGGYEFMRVYREGGAIGIWRVSGNFWRKISRKKLVNRR